MRNSKLRIAVLGYIVRGPLGGLAWHHLQYVLGLKKLGHDVVFLEDSDDYAACYNPLTSEVNTNPGYGLRFIDDTFKRLNLENRWAYYDAHAKSWFGKTEAEMFEFFASTDVLLNVSGVNPLRDWLLKIPKRVLIDTDPAFTQIRHLTDKNARQLAKKHNFFLTFGENYGHADCSIPKDGFEWKPTRQPLVPDHWKVLKGFQNSSWTTIMQWDSYRTLEYDGQIFGMKSASFDEYVDLPTITGEKFELAIGSANAPRDFLQNKGWNIINPLVPTRSPWSYQEFIQNSKAEWSVAKHGYAASRSGWFSERSVAYLASGRPVLTQETGFSKFVASGEGLLSFSSLAETVDGIDRINSDYEFHCKKAREIAQGFFNYKNVLTRLIEIIYAT
ncbi:MAG: hypothetical protein M3Q33_02405 [Acidobacteriota bacterium]|nr:hypothetical protein [Acidobacteriota bacterium]